LQFGKKSIFNRNLLLSKKSVNKITYIKNQRHTWHWTIISTEDSKFKEQLSIDVKLKLTHNGELPNRRQWVRSKASGWRSSIRLHRSWRRPWGQRRDLRSISSTLYPQLLWAQIPNAPKDRKVSSVSCAFGIYIFNVIFSLE